MTWRLFRWLEHRKNIGLNANYFFDSVKTTHLKPLEVVAFIENLLRLPNQKTPLYEHKRKT
jgi:hypothetical protein